MTIRRACHVMGFHVPPVDKKELRKVFLKLTLEYHPDQGGAKASPQKMAELTDAYRLLRKLQSDGVRVTSHSSSSSTRSPSTAEEDIAAAGSSFQAPGFGASSDGVWLPWQRGPTTQTIDAENANRLTLLEYVRLGKRRAQNQQQQRAASQKASQGSHGFDAAHMESQRKMRVGGETADRMQSYSSGHPVALACRYMVQRVRQMPKRLLLNARFIVLGR